MTIMNQGKPKPPAGPTAYEVRLVKDGPWILCKEATEALGGLRYVLKDGTRGQVRHGMFRKVPAPQKAKITYDF